MSREIRLLSVSTKPSDERSRDCQSHPSDYKIIEMGTQSLTFCDLSGLTAFMSELKSWRVFWQSLFLWKGRLENCNLSVVIKLLTISIVWAWRELLQFSVCVSLSPVITWVRGWTAGLPVVWRAIIQCLVWAKSNNNFKTEPGFNANSFPLARRVSLQWPDTHSFWLI